MKSVYSRAQLAMCLAELDAFAEGRVHAGDPRLAEALGIRPLVAHCHPGLGALYATTGQWEQASSALAMTFWLPQAEAALAQVAEVAPPAALPLAREVALPSPALQG